MSSHNQSFNRSVTSFSTATLRAVTVPNFLHVPQRLDALEGYLRLYFSAEAEIDASLGESSAAEPFQSATSSKTKLS